MIDVRTVKKLAEDIPISKTRVYEVCLDYTRKLYGNHWGNDDCAIIAEYAHRRRISS